MIDTVQTDGNRLLVMKGTRIAGTRVGIHVHEYGRTYLCAEWRITDFVEGQTQR